MVKSPLMNAIRQTVSEFSENTSIHGVRYIAENGRRWVERFLWIVTEAVCVTGAVYMLLYLLSKFQGNPTMTRVESYFHEVADVPFPAITLCNVNRVFRSRARSLVDRLKMPESYALARQAAGLPDEQDVMRLLPLLGQLLASADMGSDIAGRVRLERILNHNNLTAEAVLEEVGQPCAELIERCSWEGRELECTGIFTKTISYLGFCCSFNSEFDFTSAQFPQMAVKGKRDPLKTSFFGYPLGLTVLLNPRVEDYYWGPFASGGVMCAVHDSNEIATERTPQAMVSIDKESMVQVMPSIRNASQLLRSLAPLRRRCLFEDENPLAADEEYSYDSCTIECDASKIWRACGCRPLNFPRLPGNRGTLCGLSKLGCLAKYSEDEHDAMAKSQVRGDMLPASPGEAEQLSEAKFQTCGCLAQCNSVSYDLETTTANFGASQWVRRHFYENINATSRSLLHVYFDSQTSALLITDLVSNTVQLMSSFGGIFSLFLGCSFMSAVEVLYFFTVRLWLLVRGGGGGGGGGAVPTLPPAPVAATPHFDPNDGVPRSFAHRAMDDAWGWGSDKPTRPRAF